MMGKHMRLRVRQASYNHLTVGHLNDAIMILDYNSNGDGGNLRSLIMKIQSLNSKTSENLFDTIGQDWKGRYTFNLLKHKEEEATIIADTITPFLVDGYGDLVLQFFDQEAVIEKAQCKWNTEKGTTRVRWTRVSGY